MNRMKAVLLVLCVAPAFLDAPASKAQQTGTPSDAVGTPSLTADQVVGRMEEKNRERAAALRKFQSTRKYRMEYHGTFGNRDAEMTVSLTYASPDKKEFTILSQSGSKFIVDHILKRLLSEEKEASTEENRQRAALSAKNYDFSLAGVEGSPEAPQYMLNVIPKSDNKYLYRGRIWVDAKDFAVTRIEAEPAKNPSFWIKKSEIKHRYQKVDGFWLPLENRSESWIRLGGHALLLIEYKDYRLTEIAPLKPVEGAGGGNAGSGLPAVPRQGSPWNWD
jgi:hypothetical protein